MLHEKQTHYSNVVIGYGIGVAGFLSKQRESGEPGQGKTLIITRENTSPVKIVHKDISNGKSVSYEYLNNKKHGNLTTWGGVIAYPEKSSLGENIYSHAFSDSLLNYFRAIKNKVLSNRVTVSYIQNELIARKLCENTYARKLLMTNRKALVKNLPNDVETIFHTIKRLKKENDLFHIYDDKDELIAVSKQITLCAGAFETHRILSNSGYLTSKNSFFATDSKFGRIGRIRFSSKTLFGLFHHHMVGKKIRFKTGVEINNGNTPPVMFFLQPAIRGIPATDIHLLKEFISLKTKLSVSKLVKFVFNPRLLIQLFLLESSIASSTTDYDIYCIADMGKQRYNFDNEYFHVNTEAFYSNIVEAYQYFLSYLSDQKVDSLLLDHTEANPLLENLESAFHLCGTVGYTDKVVFNSVSKTWSLKDEENIMINDNSIIIDKGVANPSIQLF